ncbi:MAG: hypothetical protein JSV04_10190 [Candidatus Heimdallarchaeota archaeon]|nr:MAG: hypothetical protein JSV04_10190 [Candidatus Heimdallarchaeota archaeon]
MVGITLSSDELQIIFDILGLDENQSLVYLSLLSAGTLTLGQISQLSGLHYLQVRDAMEVLVGGDYVNWTPGKINRYYAQEPFLKAFLLAYDPFTLLSIRDETKKRISGLEKDIQIKIQSLFGSLSEENRVTIQQEYDLIKANLEQQQKQIDNEISALNFTISEMRQRLKFLFEMSRKLSTSTQQDLSGLITDLVFGETTFLLLLKDITSRAKVSLTVLMPHLEIQTLMTATKLPLPVRTRTSFIGDFSKAPRNILQKVVSAQIKLKETSVDFWGCIRDNEEVLVGFLPQNSQDEVFGITSTNSTMIQFLGQQIRIYSMKGKDLVIN